MPAMKVTLSTKLCHLPKEPLQKEGIQPNIFNLAKKNNLDSTQSALKNFGLSKQAFEQMLEELQAGNRQLFETVFLAHFTDCRRFLEHRYQASPEDAYDASMEAMLLFCKRLKAGKISYGNLRFLFTQMAGQVYLKWVKKQLPQESIDGMDIGIAPEGIDQASIAILNNAWDKLCGDCQQLLKNFYYENTPLKNIALQKNKTAAAIRKQKQRCVEKLQALFAQLV